MLIGLSQHMCDFNLALDTARTVAGQIVAMSPTVVSDDSYFVPIELDGRFELAHD